MEANSTDFSSPETDPNTFNAATLAAMLAAVAAYSTEQKKPKPEKELSNHKQKIQAEKDAARKSKQADRREIAAINAQEKQKKAEQKERQDILDARLSKKMETYTSQDETTWKNVQPSKAIGGGKPLYSLAALRRTGTRNEDAWDEWLLSEKGSMVMAQKPASMNATPNVVPINTPAPKNPIYVIDGPITVDQIPPEFRCTLPETKIIDGRELRSDYYYRCKVGEQLMEGILTDQNGWWWHDGEQRGTSWKGIRSNEDVWKLALTLGLDAEGTKLRINPLAPDFAKNFSLAFRNKFWYLDHAALPSYSNGEVIDFDVPTLGTNGRLTYLGSLEALETRVDGDNGFVKKVFVDSKISFLKTGKLASEVIKPPFDGYITVNWESAYNTVKDFIWPEPTWKCPPKNDAFDFANPYSQTPQSVIDALKSDLKGEARNEIIYMHKGGPINQWVYILTLEQKEYFYGHPILCLP